MDLPYVAFDGHIRLEAEPDELLVRHDGRLVARSDRAIRLLEGDREAVHYLPVASLEPLDWRASGTVTHCPWKGDASYRDLDDASDLVWQYPEPRAELAGLADYVAFDAARVTLERRAASSVDLASALSQIDRHWSPRIAAGFNGNDVMIVKALGEFTWHAHPETDDLFLVLSGRLRIDLPDGRSVTLGPGQLYVVPRGVQHRPVAEIGTEMIVIEPAGTPNTGDPATAVAKPRL